MENEKTSPAAEKGEKKNNNFHRGGRRRHHKKNYDKPQTVSPVKDENEVSEASSAQATAPDKSASAPQKNDNGNNSHKNKNKNRSKHKRQKERAEKLALDDAIDDEISILRRERPVGAFSHEDEGLDFLLGERSKYADDMPEEKFAFDDDFNLETTFVQKQDKDDGSPKVEIVGIRFKPVGKIYYFDPAGIKLTKGQFAIVETARGAEFGEVCLANSFIPEKDITPPLRPVLRVASRQDIEHNKENKKKEDEAFSVCLEKIAAHGLDMKLVEVQFTFDNSKLLFYFTSSGRVDFRELVKDLAAVFRTRIELRQIGIRDEAKLMGGLGICGRPLCCASFLSDFVQVSIKMAKEQNLSLNSAKISGCCGRLMCCLNYEYETYEEEIRRTPPVDSFVSTPDGVGFVTEISPLAGTVKVKLKDQPDVAPKTFLRSEVKVIGKSDVGE